MVTAPCKNCQDRVVTPEFNCHTDCQRYKAMQEEYATIREARKNGQDVEDYVRSRVTKYRRRMRHRKGGAQ